ncbi:MAG TPA: hypothetical protein PKD95_04325 [Candidatus Paceibacterota bacterium]|nr:hypothetical protein [Candidatus Paceibacterota bacterium]
MSAYSKDEAMRIIQALHLRPYIVQALLKQTLTKQDAEIAASEYRQQMLLIWINQKMSGREQIVPTVRADAVWHEHILDAANYRMFCDRLYGRFIDHTPGLRKGSVAHNAAVRHTVSLQQKYASNDNGNLAFMLLTFADPMLGDEMEAIDAKSATDSKVMAKPVEQSIDVPAPTHSISSETSPASSCSSSSSCGGGGGCGGGS